MVVNESKIIILVLIIILFLSYLLLSWNFRVNDVINNNDSIPHKIININSSTLYHG